MLSTQRRDGLEGTRCGIVIDGLLTEINPPSGSYTRVQLAVLVSQKSTHLLVVTRGCSWQYQSHRNQPTFW